MQSQVNVHEAQRHFSKLLQRVMNGEEIIITKSGKPAALLSPFEKAPERRTPGNDAGMVQIFDDFDAPLPDFEP